MKLSLILSFSILVINSGCKKTQLSRSKASQVCPIPSGIGDVNKEKLILALKEISNDIPTIREALDQASSSQGLLRSSVNSILEPLSSKIKKFYDEVKNSSESISAAVVLLKNPDIMAEEAKLLDEIKNSLKNFDPAKQKQVTREVARMIQRADNLRASQLAEQLKNNLATALFVKAGNPSSLDILPDGQGNFRVMLRKEVRVAQNALQPAGDTKALRKNWYTYKLHEHAGSTTSAHLMSDYFDKNPWDDSIINYISSALPVNGVTSERVLGKFFDSVHGNLYGARLRNGTLISEDWNVLQKGYLRKDGFTTVFDPKKIDIAFYRPKSELFDKAALRAKIDDLAGRYSQKFGTKFPGVDSDKLVEVISERLAKSSKPIIDNNRLTRDEWFRMTQTDPFISNRVSGIELVPSLCKGAQGLTLLNHNRVEAAQGLGFHIEINMSKNCSI